MVFDATTTSKDHDIKMGADRSMTTSMMLDHGVHMVCMQRQRNEYMQSDCLVATQWIIQQMLRSQMCICKATIQSTVIRGAVTK